ncbi:MAG: lysoplasmalogenase [Ferruginibacter sp.]
MNVIKAVSERRHSGFYIFIALACLQLIAVAFNIEGLRFITKPLLMPVLAVAVYYNSTSQKRSYIIAALFFSFIGDSFLLLEKREPLFFIFGLASFLITHILYTIYFLRLKQIHPSPLKTNWYIFLLILFYGAGLVFLLYPLLGALKIPVLLYATIICLMLISSFHVYKSVAPATGLQFITGALLFVISDSFLAINKFYQPFQLAPFLIMLTYCAAQFLIARGFTSQEGKFITS